MRLLQRYILLELVRVFVFLLSVLTVLLVFVGVFREVSESGLGPLQALQILPYIVPSLLPFTIPATLLLTVCVVYGRISGDQEITAAKAAGINVLSLLWPAFLMGAALSLVSLVLTDQVIPWAIANIQRTVALAMEDIFLDMLRSQHHLSDDRRGFAITVDNVVGDVLVAPVFVYTPAGGSPVTIQAAEATLDFDLDNQQVVLHLVQAYMATESGTTVFLADEDHPFPLPQEISKPKPRHMTIRDLRQYVIDTRQRYQDVLAKRDIEAALAMTTGDYDRFLQNEFASYSWLIHTEREERAKFETEVHSRFAMCTSCLFFVLVGGPFSILQGRKQFLTSFFLCFLPILLIYYPIALLMMNLSKTCAVEPAYAMWAGNAALLVVGLTMLARVLRR